MALTGRQRRALRALGHHLQVVVKVGQDGVTTGVEKLATATGAGVAQVLGRTVLLYKANPDQPRIRI